MGGWVDCAPSSRIGGRWRLTSLEELSLASNPVSDLTPIADLPLTHLYLGGTDVEHVAPLAGMTTLKVLVLTGIRDRVLDLDTLDLLVAAGLEIHPAA